MRHDSTAYTAHYENVLGTSLELQLVASTARAAAAAEQAALREIDRLESILSGYSADSELSRWLASPAPRQRVSAELAEVLVAAEYWRMRTDGAFNPAARAIGDALQADVTIAHIRELVSAMRAPLWEVDRARGEAERRTPLAVSVDGIAKGYIVRRAALASARVDGISAVLLNIGGDIQHVGTRPVRVAIANPFDGAENAEPLDVIALQGQAVATSGGYRRGLSINGHWHSHILDPRTGVPVARVASASVFAPDCSAADALSTACSVLDPREAATLVDAVAGAGCLIVEANGRVTTSSRWKQRTYQTQTTRAVS